MNKNIKIVDLKKSINDMHHRKQYVLGFEFSDKAIFTNGTETLNINFGIGEKSILKAAVMNLMANTKIIHISDDEIVFQAF